MTNDEMEQILLMMKEMLNYVPVLYTQKRYIDKDNNNEFCVEYKHSSPPENGLLYMVPIYSCTSNAKLILKIPVATTGYTTQYEEKEYTILVEQADGSAPKTCVAGDIRANRLCVFRFTGNYAIVLNSPIHNSAYLQTLTASNALFMTTPKVMQDGTNQEDYLVSSTTFKDLQSRVEKLENKIKFGTASPTEGLKDSEPGTIYIHIEEE